MSPDWIVLCLAGFIAVMLLVKLMLRRQKQLIELLRSHSTTQLEWSRKKARAALLARQAALNKSNQEDLSELTGMINAQETIEA